MREKRAVGTDGRRLVRRAGQRIRLVGQSRLSGRVRAERTRRGAAEDPALKAAMRLRRLAARARETSKRVIVLLAGAPGSGKTTLAERAVRLAGDTGVLVLPMDGFHLPMAMLSADERRRRGAHYTFDVGGLLAVVEQLRRDEDEHIEWPRFDHAHGDPSAPGSGMSVTPNDRVVLIEGLYLLLAREHACRVDGSCEGRWAQLASIADERWFVTCDDDEASSRLVARHMQANGNTEEEARHRVESNDALNAALIHKSFREMPRNTVSLVLDNTETITPTSSPSLLPPSSTHPR